MIQILAATSNKHKIQEFKSVFAPLLDKIALTAASELPNYPEIIENGSSFEENADIKAVKASAFADMTAFADDSGLEVVALNGAPGIFSSRYAGDNATDSERVAKLLCELKGCANRRARFVCVISLAYRGEFVKHFRGIVNGKIAEAPSGSNGFGYDPVFIPDGYDKTFAELGCEVKDKISHRAEALAKLLDFIRGELSSLDGFDIS